MQGFRLYEINFDAIQDELYHLELRLNRAEADWNRSYEFAKPQAVKDIENRTERVLKVKQWYKQRIIKFINTL